MAMADVIYKVAGIDACFIGHIAKADVGAPAIDAIALVLPVGAGQGAQFAGASALTPIPIKVDAEGMLVTGVTGDSLTVTRGAYGTTAAAHTAGSAKVNFIEDVQVPFTHTVTPQPQNTEITFVGDADQDYKSLSLGLRGTLQADKWSTAVWRKILGVRPVDLADDTTMPPDVLRRWYIENGIYPQCRCRVYLIAENDATGQDTALRVEMPLFKIYPRPQNIPTIGNAAKTEFGLSWTATRVKTDLLGFLLPVGTGVLPKRGVRFYYDELSSELP